MAQISAILARVASRPGPAGSTSSIAALSWPVLKTRVSPPRRRSRERPGERAGSVLAANHSSNFDPWPLGIPLFPRRFLRFMAKSELFWFPLGKIITAGGAFPVRRGQRDEEAIATAVALCRAGHVVVMFPEGTRREKGMRKKHEARWHTGAARIALEAGVPLVPAGIAGTDRLARLAPLRVRYGPARRPRRSRRACRRPTLRRSRPTGCSAPSPSWSTRSRETAARCRRRLVRAPRLPRDSEDVPARGRRPGERALRVRDHAPPALAGRASRAHVLVAWDTLEVPTLPPRGARRVPGRAGVRRRAARAARSSPRARQHRRALRVRRRRATRRTTSSARPSRPRRPTAGPCSSRPPIATRFSSPGDDDDPPAGAWEAAGSHRARRGA